MPIPCFIVVVGQDRAMAPTGLGTIGPPEVCLAWVKAARPREVMLDHPINVDPTW